MKVYLSSTYLDLMDHRHAVAVALRKAKYNVILMEEHAARDEAVEFACQGDVAACDTYVGIFAWRHGHVPEDDNPQRSSITEMEFAAAVQRQIPTLIFLLGEDTEWPKESKDVEPARINALRAQFKKRCAAYFSDPNSLAVEVLAALRVLESTRFARQLDAVTTIQHAQQMGPSYLLNIKEKLSAFRETALIELQTGPIPWWNTRLHLIAALAEEFGVTKELVFVDAERHLLAMASPTEVRRRLAQRWPALEVAYLNFRRDLPTLEAIAQGLWRYPTAVAAAFGNEEQMVIEVISAQHLERELGLARSAETVEIEDKGQVFLQREILGRHTPYAALVRQGRLEGLVDSRELARRVADKALAQLG